MAKDTKEIIIRVLLNIAAEHGPLTVEEISRRSGITRNTIQKNFGNKGISGIVEYIYSHIIDEVNERLFQHDANELPIEIFADILLSVVWKYHEQIHVLYTSELPFKPVSQATNTAYPWVKERYEWLVKEHGLAPLFSSKELLFYWNAQLIAILSLWLGADIPVEPSVFKPKFVYLVKTSLYDLIYKGIGH